MNWGSWIIVAFVLFAVFVATLVTLCVTTDISLVTRDYYKEELAYQQQLDRKQNANGLEVMPDIVINGTDLEVHYPDLGSITSGVVTLFRPSDASLDLEFPILPTGGVIQRFPLSRYDKGLYKARMQWVMRGKEYYIEKIIVL